MKTLDKVEYNTRLDQINALVEKHDIQGALEIVETIDWRRIKSIRTLCMVADIYEAGRMYEESKEILLLAYNRSSVGKAILYRLVEISIKLGQMDDAVEYYSEYAKNARDDSSQYLLKYKIYQARRAPLEEQAEILEQYKSKEYTERWAFELARIYDRMGMKDKCIEECDDLILWFSEGKYVAKAMELKQKYMTLSPMQQEIYGEMQQEMALDENRSSAVEEASDNDNSIEDSLEDEESIKERNQRMTTVAKESLAKRNEENLAANRNSEDLQAKVSSSFRDVFSGLNKVKENIIAPFTSEENDEEVAEIEDVSDYDGIVKDLEPEELKPTFKGGASEVKQAVPSGIEEPPVIALDATTKISDEAASEDDDINKIISETASTMAEQVEHIKTGKDDEKDIKEDIKEDTKEGIKADIKEDIKERIEPAVEEEAIEEQILRPETAEEKRLRILNGNKPEKLSDEQKQIFSYFAKIPGMDSQLLDALHGVYAHASDRTSKKGNIAIMGARGTGKTRLFEGIVKVICHDLGITATKVACLNATALNDKDPAEVIAKMAGGFLLIEGAGAMSEETITKLSKALEFRTDSMILVIEDEKEKMRQLLKDHQGLADNFMTVISIPVFTNDELVTFARTYARERGYKVDEMGVLALYDLIGSRQSERDPITIDGVRIMMEEAIAKTQKVTRKFGRKLAVRNTDEEGNVIIYEKDFY